MTSQIVLKGYHWPQSVLEATPPNGVFYLALNMTSACNYRCPYCFVGLANLKPSPYELRIDEKIRLIGQAADCGAKVVVMPGRGEPWPIRTFGTSSKKRIGSACGWWSIPTAIS